ncbi:MAG: hypothetical protein HQ594_03090 [Candidatus Omnitrophica bacterium]|nr:hypothetical protein [Candidatus Omnitrophota bacterium]
MKLSSILLTILLLFSVSFSEASVESGNWSANQEIVWAGLSNAITHGPFTAYVNASSNVIDISFSMESSTYRFHGDVSGDQLTGTLFSSSGMGTFETPFSGQITPDENQISIRLAWVWSYNGRQDRWVKKTNASETWTFTR